MFRWSSENSEWNYLDKRLAADPTFLAEKLHEWIQFLEELYGYSEGKDVHSSAVNLYN